MSGTSFWLLGNPDVGLATSCCLCKTPAFGFEDQSFGLQLLQQIPYLANFLPTSFFASNPRVTVHREILRRIPIDFGHRLSRLSVKASGSLPHFEHTLWPPLFADLVELCLSSLAPFPVVAFSVCYPGGRGADPARGAPGGG
ncbi:hypothetical protein F511_40410 [Dorcoceras hygrometricum]|uniref:Uncharacterized protein n=1 Tax=Dorcoceras hygrometricum TaxID=472368 RepID=A0A2Z7BWV4_9LAMI|nr:hypothetical protein F511_40410 [Dorcoceras hygrometricum]